MERLIGKDFIVFPHNLHRSPLFLTSRRRNVSRAAPSAARTAAEWFSHAYGDIIMTRFADVLATVDIRLLEDKLVKLSGLKAIVPHRALGSRLICELVDLADAHGVTLLAEVRPGGHAGPDMADLGMDDLVAWFSRFGFRLSNRPPSVRIRHPFEKLFTPDRSGPCRVMLREPGHPGMTLLENGKPVHLSKSDVPHLSSPSVAFMIEWLDAGPARKGIDAALQAAPVGAGIVHLSAIRACTPRRGHGTRLMILAAGIAERTDAILSLDAKPFGDDPMTDDMLVSWYGRFGFREIATTTPEDGRAIARWPDDPSSTE